MPAPREAGRDHDHTPHLSPRPPLDPHELEIENAQLRAALESRDLIGMAKGILMHAEGIGPDEAFQVLVRSSKNQNRKLRDIAAELVATYPERDA